MENEELVEQIQAGIKPTENMEQLYLQNRSFIYQQAKKYAAYADMDDLMQEAYFGLHEAVKHYKPDKETRFLTYLPFRLQSAFRRYIDNNGHTKRIPIHLVQRISKYKKYIAEQQKTGVEPSDSEICRDLELSEQQLKDLRKAMREAECISTSDSNNTSTVNNYYQQEKQPSSSGESVQTIVVPIGNTGNGEPLQQTIRGESPEGTTATGSLEGLTLNINVNTASPDQVANTSPVQQSGISWYQAIVLCLLSAILVCLLKRR